MEQKILPCKHCGAKAELDTDERVVSLTKSVYIKCSGCGIRTDNIYASIDYYAKDKAVEIWNRRVDAEQESKEEFDFSEFVDYVESKLDASLFWKHVTNTSRHLTLNKENLETICEYVFSKLDLMEDVLSKVSAGEQNGESINRPQSTTNG